MRLRGFGRTWWVFLLLLARSGAVAAGQGPGPTLPPGGDEPLPRLEVGGPTGLVTALAFSPDGDSLYEAGWDKVVRVWRRDAGSGAFGLDPRATYRVPIGPGTDGAINALALSPDGTWLAVAGNGIVRGGAGFRRPGLMIPAAARTDAMRADQGLIFVFNTRSEPRSVRLLRGHLGPVLSLEFVPGPAGRTPRLVSSARERDDLGVVRLWDVERGGLLDQGSIPLDPNASSSQTRPGLAAWPTGAGPTQLRVAIAWGDGQLRLWDVERDRGRPTAVGDGRFNNTVASFGGSSPLSGSLRDEQGRLTLWQPVAGAGAMPLADARRPIALAPPGDAPEAPRALALAPSRPGGSLDLAAVVVLRVPGRVTGQGEAGLRLIDLNAGSWGMARARVDLWPVDLKRPTLPVLAVDPTGRSLAVAGTDEREVWVFALADVLRGQPAPRPQRLRGAGVTIRRVGFVRNGPNLGLRLTGAAGDLILDPARSRLSADRTGWDAADAAPEGWRAEPVPAGLDAQKRPLEAVAVRQGAGPSTWVRLGPDQVVSEVALLPPRPPRRVPIVAVAYVDHGEPGLGLYNGQSGEPVRQLSGHAERIRGLSFSDDGRLLASAADDRTVCVWSLTDLDQTLHRRGGLQGVAVTESDGGLVVARLDPDSPARAGDALREGDAVRGLVESGNLRPLASASEFYLAVSHIRPGETVTVRRARGGEAFADVTLRVGQGVDERKPLLSLLAMRGAGAGEGTWSWVGWNPLGPYEASGPDAERRLGWHFNTGQPEMPTRFALADQYRKYRREGLLRDLIEQGQLAPPAAPKPRPRPDLGLTLDPEGEIDGQGRTLVRRAPGALDLTLLDRTWTAEEVESVRWALDDAPARPMAPAGAERTWSADLSQVAWARGVHRVAVTLRTREATPQEFTEKRLVRLVPPPPRIETEMPASTLVVSRPEFTFRARVTPSRGPVKVRLVHQSGGGARPPRERKADGPLVIDEPLTLEPGSNTIELSAENAEAPPADRELETSRLAPRIIVYNRVPAIPPSVMLEGITVLRGGVEGGPTRPAGGGEPVVVTAPKVRVEGRITAQEKLSGAEWLRSEGAKAQRLAGFLPDRETAFTIREAIDLVPGVQRLRFRARAADSATTEAEVTIDYRPPVPEVADVVLDPSDAVVFAAPGADPPHARLRARLIATGDRHPFEAAILVNGEEQPGRPVIDEAAGTLTAEVPLQPGDNRIQVRLGNAWRSAWITEPVGVTYRRPPRVVALETGAVGDRPFLDVSARVESPDDLPPTRGRVVVKGKRASGAEIDVGEFRRDEAAWVLSAREVPIEPGENAVEVWAWNDDGRSREPGRRAGIIYRAPPPPKPEVEFLSPARDTTVSTPAPAVEFRVRSESPLTKVELLRLRSESDRQVVHAADVAKLLKDAQGRFEVRAAPVVTLAPQDNLLRVVAVNAGGESTASLRLSYLPPPVRVVVDRIKPREPGAKPVAPAVREDNRIIFADPVPSGRITMQGRVIWPDEQSRRQKGAGRVQVWVNGLPQVHVPLRPHADRALEGTFEAKILLGREDNQVEIKVPELAREAGDRPVFRLACARPEGHQRLHLLIVGVGQEDEVALRNRALQALQGRLREGSTTAFATPAFSEGRIYGPLAHDVKKTQLLYQLGLIRNAINPLQTATEAPNEVVLIYYQGGEWVDQGKSYLRLRTGRGRNQSDVIALEELAGLFTGTRGAHLFLLDVTRSRVAPIGPALRAASWPGDDDVPIGLLQFAWLNPADAAPGEPPQDARLITALQEAMPKSATVREVTAKVRQRVQRLGKRFPNLYYDQLLTPPIAELIIGRP